MTREEDTRGDLGKCKVEDNGDRGDKGEDY